ncbi:MAG TPA: TonB-dependent receptor [Caulobacteraceae bacterium]
MFAPQAFAATATAGAGSTALGSGVVGELVVVAEKREENVETVPVAVTAFSAKTRALEGIKSMQDFSDMAPGLAYNSVANRPYIRGIGRNTDNLATASAVAIYYNGIYDGANGNSILQKDDLFIDTVEIDRGPQNLLHGANSDGGTINYISKKPTHEFYAEGRLGGGSYGKWDGEAVVSGPISDNVRFRLGGNYTDESGGYFTNLDQPGSPQGGDIAQGNSGSSYYLEAQLDANFDHLDLWGMVSTGDYSTNYHTTSTFGNIPLNYLTNGGFTPSNFYGLCGVPGVATANAGNAAMCSTGPAVVGVNADPVLASSFPGNDPTNLNPRQFIQETTSTNHEQDDVALAGTATYHFPSFDLEYLGGYQSFHYVLNFTNGADSGLNSYQLAGTPADVACPGLSGAALVACNGTNAAIEAPLSINASPSTTWFLELDKFFSHELNISSTAPGPFQWMAGLYWYNENYAQPVAAGVQPNQTQLANPFSLCVNEVNPGTSAPTCTSGFGATNMVQGGFGNTSPAVSNSDTFLQYNSYAVFGSFDYKFNDQWKFEGGVRYTDDQKQGSQIWRFVELEPTICGVTRTASGALSCPADPLTGQFYVKGGSTATATDVTEALMLGTGLPGETAYPGAGIATYNAATGFWQRPLSLSNSAFTGEAGIDWTPDDSTLAYAKYSRGYKSGGFTTFTLAANPETKPEFVDAVEIGAKKTFGRTFTANVAAFYYNYANDQIPLTVQNSAGLLSGQLFNLATVHTYGVELEGIWRPIDPLIISAQYSYLQARVASAGSCIEDTTDPFALVPGANATAACNGVNFQKAGVVQTQDLTGESLPQATPNKFSINGLYTLTFDPGKLTLSGTVIWKDKTYGSLFNRPYAQAPAYSQVNLRATFTDTKDRYSVILYGNNVFNTLGSDGTTGSALLSESTAAAEGFSPTNFIVENESLTAPTTYGIEVQVRWR